jgi:uncharacterized protein (TIGR03083 family)
VGRHRGEGCNYVGRVDRVEVYTETRARLLTLGRSLDDTAAATKLPTCPDWTVREAYAHLVGINADALCGRLEGVAEDWWTQRQVDERSDRTLAEILDEWDEIGPSFLAVLQPDTTPPQLVLDAWSHEQDIRGAVHVPGGPQAEVTRDHAELIARSHVRAVNTCDLDDLDIRFDDFVVSRGDHAVVLLDVDPHEYLRGAFGRRSRRQIRAWDWRGTEDVDPYIDPMLIFGMATEDVIEPSPS